MTEVIVDNFSLLESRKDREARSQNSGYAPQNNGSSYAGNSNQNTNFQPNNSAPNTNNAAPQDPFADSGSTIDISDDDLPF